MALREKLNEKPAVAVGAGIALVACALGFLYYMLAGANAPASTFGGKAFFTIDDGQTWFADDSSKLAPFDHDGKQAVKAYVFASNGKKFANSLERFTPEGKSFAQAALDASSGGKPGIHTAPKPGVTLTEVKRPGDKTWVAQSDLSKSAAIMAVRSPDGHGEATVVEP